MYPTQQVHNPNGRFDIRRKTLAFIEELSKELLELKPRHERINPRSHEFDVYEYDKGIYIVDARGVKGYISSDEDLLTSYWWALFLGLIRNVDTGDVVNTGGVSFTLRASGDVNAAAAYISYGGRDNT